MAKPEWPAADKRVLLGKSFDRADGPEKITGAAKYSFDIHRPGMLWAKPVWSPHPRATVVAVHLDDAKAIPGVKAIWTDDDILGKEVTYAGFIVAAVAAETEEIAAEAAQRVRVDYTVLEHQVRDDDPKLGKDRPSKKETGNVDEAFTQAATVHSGYYGCPVITHCCLEPHGQVTDFKDGELMIWPSTQNVSRYTDRLGEAVGVEQNRIKVDCQHMGGGFGSKFNFDNWGKIGAQLSKQTGRPVKLLLDRDLELMIAGNRPSAYATIKVGATKDGTVTAVESEVWGHGGHRRLQRAARSVRVHQNPQHAHHGAGDPHQPWRATRLARAQSSAGLFPHHERVRRRRRRPQDR